jgi:predicted GNAT superfamily acetyltransferase
MQTVSLVQNTKEAEAVANFFKSVWADGPEVVPFDLILAAIHVGSYCAFMQTEGQVVAASFGLLGRYQGKNILHSHVTASNQAGAGYALKMHQRDWANDIGLHAITWTFDPLVRRNCYFNFVKLGACAVEYLPDFYGTMTDSINVGDKSDRLFAYWEVADTTHPSPRLLIDTQSAGQIQAVQVALPDDIEALRKVDLEQALVWRERIAVQLQPKLDNGWRVTGMSPDRNHLVLTAPN